VARREVRQQRSECPRASGWVVIRARRTGGGAEHVGEAGCDREVGRGGRSGRAGGREIEGLVALSRIGRGQWEPSSASGLSLTGSRTRWLEGQARRPERVGDGGDRGRVWEQEEVVAVEAAGAVGEVGGLGEAG